MSESRDIESREIESTATENAAVWRRLVATGIDFVAVPAMSFLVMWVSGVMEHAAAYAGNQPLIRGIGLGIVGYLILNGWLLASRGQTLGKWCTGIKLVGKDGNKPAWWRLIFIRALFFPLLYLPLLYAVFGLFALLPLIDVLHALRADRRCLHDMAAGTRVVVSK